MSDPDPNTDPGRPHPYESLYRSAAGDAAAPSRPTPRHFEQHLSRPDGAQEGFGWLYRDDPPAVVPAPVAAEPSTRVPPVADQAVINPWLAPPAQPRRPTLAAVLILVLLVVIGVVVVAVLTGQFPG